MKMNLVNENAVKHPLKITLKCEKNFLELRFRDLLISLLSGNDIRGFLQNRWIYR